MQLQTVLDLEHTGSLLPLLSIEANEAAGVPSTVISSLYSWFLEMDGHLTAYGSFVEKMKQQYKAELGEPGSLSEKQIEALKDKFEKVHQRSLAVELDFKATVPALPYEVLRGCSGMTAQKLALLDIAGFVRHAVEGQGRENTVMVTANETMIKLDRLLEE